MRDNSSGFFAMFLIALWIFGFYKIISNDHRYTTKDVVIASVVFPYPWWVGGKEIYKIVTVPSYKRKLESKCLDDSSAAGIGRSTRLRYCACLAETRNAEMCAAKLIVQ